MISATLLSLVKFSDGCPVQRKDPMYESMDGRFRLYIHGEDTVEVIGLRHSSNFMHVEQVLGSVEMAVIGLKDEPLVWGENSLVSVVMKSEVSDGCVKHFEVPNVGSNADLLEYSVMTRRVAGLQLTSPNRVDD